MRACFALLLASSWLVAQTSEPPAVEPQVVLALQRAVDQLDVALNGLRDPAVQPTAAIERVLAQFVADHPGAHAAFAEDLRLLGNQLGTGPSHAITAPLQVRNRWYLVVERPLQESRGVPRTLRCLLGFSLAATATAPVAQPTFAANLHGSPAAALAGTYQCPPCGFSVIAPQWLAVPTPPCRAEAIEGATFFLAGTALACELSVRVAEPGQTALDAVRSLAEGFLPTASAIGLPTPWLPPDLRHADGLSGAQLEVRLSDAQRARLLVLHDGALQQVFCCTGPARELQHAQSALADLFAGYQRLDVSQACDNARRALEHHTGGVLLGNRYRNERFDLAFGPPNDWPALQRCSAMAIRVVWTTPNGSRLWLHVYPLPAGLDRWCSQSADRWIATLLDQSGLVETDFPPATWHAHNDLGGSVRDFCCRNPATDPTHPSQRLFRALLRDDVLVVLDAIPTTVAELQPLRAAMDGLQRARR